MSNGKIYEGKTTNEAIEIGLKDLKLRKEDVEIKVLENEDKRSFFSILSPRIVKIEITPLEKKQEKVREHKVEQENIDFTKPTKNIEEFLDKWIKKIPGNNLKYNITHDETHLMVNIDGDDLNYLIGHRGDVLNNLQSIMSSIAGRGMEYKVRVILNICGYKEKREKSLEELAEKLEKTVIRTRKSITLEPMTAYERKIIHTKLQDSKKVTTTSIGEEPYRKIVISLK